MRVQIIIALIGFSLLLAFPAGAVDHREFVQDAYPDGPSVTRDCLSCHMESAEAFMESAHWQWKGHAPYTEGAGQKMDLGKRNLVNNY